MLSKVFSNAIFVVLIMTLASVALSYFAPNYLSKAAFLGAIGWSAFLFSLAMVFVDRLKSAGNQYFQPIDLNIWGVVLCAIACLGAVFYFQDVSVFTDMVVENVVVATVGGASGIAMALAKRGMSE